LSFGFGGLGFGVWGLGFVFGVWGLGFGVWGLGFGVWGLGFGVWGLGFGVWIEGFGSRDQDSGFRLESIVSSADCVSHPNLIRLGFEMKNSGFEIYGFKVKVYGSWFLVSDFGSPGLGFQASGFGVRAKGLHQPLQAAWGTGSRARLGCT